MTLSVPHEKVMYAIIIYYLVKEILLTISGRHGGINIIIDYHQVNQILLIIVVCKNGKIGVFLAILTKNDF